MKKYLPKITVRLALTAWLLVYVYRETGPWTVAALALVCIGLECVTLALDKLIVSRLLWTSSSRRCEMREGFLVLSRKPGASVYIGDDIEVRVVAVTAEPGQSVPSGLAVRLAIRAPRHVAITRDDAVDKEGR